MPGIVADGRLRQSFGPISRDTDSPIAFANMRNMPYNARRESSIQGRWIMGMPEIRRGLNCIGAVLVLAASAAAQQATVGAGMHNVGDGFSENIGVGFGLRTPNGFFTNGAGVAPPVGNLNPNGGATLGFGFGGSGFNGFLNLAAAQGSSRSNSSTAMSLTVPNGGTGFIGDVVQEPFVTAFVPVVGGFVNNSIPQFGTSGLAPMGGNGSLLNERLARIHESGGLKLAANQPAASEARSGDAQRANSGALAAAKTSIGGASSAAQPIASIAEIRRQQAEEDQAAAHEIQSLLDQGHNAQAAGKTKIARAYYQQALRRASGELKARAEDALRSLGE